MSRSNQEHQAQVAVVTWATHARGEFPELALIFAIPNGGHRHPAVAAKLKAEGVKPGVPDLMLPVARGGYHGLFVEMKAEGGRAGSGPRATKGRVSEAQGAWHQHLRTQGYAIHTCYGSEAAILCLRAYLSLDPTALVLTEPRGGADRE